MGIPLVPDTLENPYDAWEVRRSQGHIVDTENPETFETDLEVFRTLIMIDTPGFFDGWNYEGFIEVGRPRFTLIRSSGRSLFLPVLYNVDFSIPLWHDPWEVLLSEARSRVLNALLGRINSVRQTEMKDLSEAKLQEKNSFMASTFLPSSSPGGFLKILKWSTFHIKDRPSFGGMMVTHMKENFCSVQHLIICF